MNTIPIIAYSDSEGDEPFVEWWANLRDSEARNRISARIRRLEQGNYGDCKNLGGGIYELRLDFGPGYRVYFGKDQEIDVIIILLCGGDKSSQKQDIIKARKHWEEYKNNAKDENL
jgi:putative addiction module killer protein